MFDSLTAKKGLTPHHIQTNALTFNKSVKKRIKELLLNGQKIVKIRQTNTFGTKAWLLKNEFGINIIHVVKDPCKPLYITYWR
tara:strand:+ start:327 stop:575 length:249 start_codon:yes stop_codon:yes gene_type:complete